MSTNKKQNLFIMWKEVLKTAVIVLVVLAVVKFAKSKVEMLNNIF